MLASGGLADLATLPQGIQEPLVVRDGDRRPPRGPTGVHCWEILAFLGVSRSMESDLSVCPVNLSEDFVVCIHCVSSLIRVTFWLFMFMCVSCFGLVVSTCQVISWKDYSDYAFML